MKGLTNEITENVATYQTTPEVNGGGVFFFTDCGHKMYSVKNEMAYHGVLCPGCLYNGKQTTLYIRGSKEANEYWKKKMAAGEYPEVNRDESKMY